MSSGEFVGIVADNPDQPIKYKPFHARITNDHAAIKKEKENYGPLQVVRTITKPMLHQHFMSIKQDANDIVDAVLDIILNDPSMNLIQKHA